MGTEPSTSHSCGEDDGLYLSLFPWAHFEVAVQPRLHNGIEVHSGNKVRCSISGREVWVTLDSGLSRTVLAKSLAQRLSLLNGDEGTMKVKVTSDTGTKKFDVVRLSGVVVTFDNGQQVCVTALVFQDTTPVVHDAATLVMGLPALRRGRMVQTFHRQGSTLFIGAPRPLLGLGRFSRAKGVGTFQVLLKSPRGYLKTVLLSTGMDGFYCSERIKNKLRRKSLKKCGPHWATLDLGGKHVLKGIPVKVLPHITTDFVMGRQVLHEHEATVDFLRKRILIPRGDVVASIPMVLRRL